MPTYTVNWAAFNEVLEQLTVLQNEVNTLNAGFAQGNSSALTEWDSEAREAFEVRRQAWNDATKNMELLAGQAQTAAAKCREEYQHAVQYGTQLWGG
ncbi:hypothetical protein [Streptomyces ziwulingensis]|uniref:WXG100 family type VII secretion target n=1 Tax=Streptomyces ziwulingensis TaxID=1045501 RepID=A0ABP9C8V0_9ACTN